MKVSMRRLQGLEKRGPKKRKNGWRFNISNIPTPVGDALDFLWRKQCVDAIKEGRQPVGWHQFLVGCWISYLESVQTEEEFTLMEAEIDLLRG